MKSEVPKSLRAWFVAHFVLDMLFALPLFAAPTWFLSLFAITTVEPALARLVSAALIGVGGTSLLVRKKNRDAFRTLLTLKLLWSGSAVVGLVLSALQGGPAALWLFAVIFAFFFGVWGYYKLRLNNKK